MSLQFIMGNSGAGKSRYAYEKILAEAARHPEKNYLIVVPEQFTMQTQKELVSLHPAGGILNIDILSFQRLAYRIFEETGGSLYPVLEETGKSLVVKRVAQEKKKELTILGSTLKRTGAVSQMKSLISELKQYQIAPSELDAWAEETGEKKLLAAKLKDTGVIYRAFEKYLENRYVTAEDVLEVLAGKLEESALIKNSEVLVDGFTGFTPVQIGVLGKLFRLCAKVYVTIIMDEREELERADAKLSPTARETMYQQKFHLYRNLTKPSERLYLSFAKAGASGEAQNPSYLINEIRKLFPEILVRDIEKEEKPEEKLEMPRSGEALFLEELGRAAEGEIDPLFEELYRWYAAHPEAGIPAETYRKAAFLRCADGVIGKSAASALYGDTLKNSATRLEKYAACAFAHFMEFGLQIRERDQYELKAADMGTVMHEALEKFSKKLQENGETWKTVTDDTRDRLIEECVEETMADYGNTIFQSSSRNQYRIIRVKRILKRTVWALQQQIRQGEFEPGEFEVSFSMEDSLSAINIDLSEHEKMRLRGRIDRVDLCETDDKVYVKIIDYKTGNTSLDLVALYYGLQLQLAVYLDAAVELEQKKHPGKQVEPAGVFYYHIDDPMLDQEEDETDEAWGRRMLKALRMDGLVNADRKVVELLDRVLEDGTTSDVIPVGKKKDGSYTSYSKVASPEQFDVIRTYTRKKVREIGEGIFSGNVKISPYQRDGATACAYCEYQGICGFDQKIQGYEYRKLKGMDTELLMKAMQEITQSDQKE